MLLKMLSVTNISL